MPRVEIGADGMPGQPEIHLEQSVAQGKSEHLRDAYCGEQVLRVSEREQRRSDRADRTLDTPTTLPAHERCNADRQWDDQHGGVVFRHQRQQAPDGAGGEPAQHDAGERRDDAGVFARC